MFKRWNAAKDKIERCLKIKELEFAHKDSRNPKLTP